VWYPSIVRFWESKSDQVQPGDTKIAAENTPLYAQKRCAIDNLVQRPEKRMALHWRVNKAMPNKRGTNLLDVGTARRVHRIGNTEEAEGSITPHHTKIPTMLKSKRYQNCAHTLHSTIEDSIRCITWYFQVNNETDTKFQLYQVTPVVCRMVTVIFPHGRS